MKATIVLSKNIDVDDEDNSLCGKGCPYRNQHPINPECKLFFGEGSSIKWLNGFAGIKRCQQCLDAAQEAQIS